MQRQRKTRNKDKNDLERQDAKTKKDKEYRETGKTPAMCAGIFFSILADWFDQKRCDLYSALPRTHVVSVISNPGFLSNCLSCTSGTIKTGQRTFSFNLRLVSDFESDGGIALTDVYHTDCQWLQCELTERFSFEKSVRKQNPCQVEGQHDEACIAMLNNFYADGAVCLLLWPDQCCIRRPHHECHAYQQHWCHFIHHYRSLQNFISMGDDDLCNLVSMMPRALSMWMWTWSGVARHRVLPQEVVRLWGFRQADGLRQADQSRARPQDLVGKRRNICFSF